jgi:Protein kinase domain
VSAGDPSTLDRPLSSSLIPVSGLILRNNNQSTPTGPASLGSGLLGTPLLSSNDSPGSQGFGSLSATPSGVRAADTRAMKKTKHGKSGASSLLKQFFPDNEDEDAQPATPKQPSSGIPTSGWQRIDSGPSQEIPRRPLTPPPVPSTPVETHHTLPVRPPHISPRRLVPQPATDIVHPRPSSNHVHSGPDAEQTLTEVTERSRPDQTPRENLPVPVRKPELPPRPQSLPSSPPLLSPRLLEPTDVPPPPASVQPESTLAPGPNRERDLYQIVAQVGEGTFGQVYKARNTQSGKYVALKRIRMESERDGFPVTAMREIKLLQSLRHENVINLHEMMVSKGGLVATIGNPCAYPEEFQGMCTWCSSIWTTI